MEKLQSLAEFLGTVDPAKPEEPAQPLQPLSAKFTARDFCRGILNSAEYRQSLRDRIVLGELPAQIECMIWDRAAGKVIEKIEIKDTTDPLDDYSAEQLEEHGLRLLELARQLRTNDEVHQPQSDEDDGHTSSVH